MESTRGTAQVMVKVHSRSFIRVVTLMVALSAGFLPGASAASPRPSGPPVKAVVVKSWSGCSSGGVIWDGLNADWEQYGDIPIEIDYSHPGLCDGPITYSALAESGADLIILSDPAGGGKEYSLKEVRALQRYARHGHNVVGTFLVFRSANLFDNRELEPLFGISSPLSKGDEPVDPTYDLLEPDNPLFRDLSDPYVSAGYPHSQVPIDGSWDAPDLRGARYVGQTAQSSAVITVYDAISYVGIYIAHMPEYGGGPQDYQFFYNAITYSAN